MAPSSSSSATATSVQVALRIRPPTNQDSTSIPARFQRSVIQATSSNTVSIEATSITASGSGSPNAASSASAAKKQLFSFDQVHPPPATQYDLFTSTARPLVSRFIEGFNCTILAYGQTSSGKTYTMTGMDLDADPSDPNNGMGIIPRAVSTIFSSAKHLKEERAGAWNYSIKASFIEIYNEDLIDLLSMDDAGGGRREVQIREDKDGHIIWGGLREMNVRNAAEVMSLIRKGTAIRRTNETDMNAQSSRSHAIFSLTLTQKKYKGSGPPPRSPSPLPPNGRSPSRLARPGSMYSAPPGNRVASPTFARPATPSFAAAMGRGGGLRPTSALGHTSDRTNGVTAAADEEGEWVTIVSKFHFVDLAGSERLKRTAAAGERIKEGISINSGLLALGNVISALGDPSRSKSNTASHIPYRDSKLTRLLQDSLGGNAHTLMIACVSPAEYNANETINTLKYANRARNIKNHAVLNEKEDGWDDVEWLQTTITRLRKELKVLKDGGTVVVHDVPLDPPEGANKKVMAQMSELRGNYEDLRAKFVQRTEELTRLRGELGGMQRGSVGGSIAGTARYEEIVGPVIEEYEKTIAAMEAELSLNRAALRHTNDMYEEKEEELALITERHAATELYVEELRGRVAKLTERESSTEAYIRDLEEKIKSYDETTLTSNESMMDLKKEVTRFKDAESHSGKYIAELEARLARSDESIVGLQQMVEKLETECEKRRDEVKMLESRLDTLKQDGDGWRNDLEEREKRVKELELKLVEWEQKKDDANDARIRLGNVVGQVANAKKGLELNLVTPSVPPSPTDASPSISPVTADTPVDQVPPPVNSALQNQFLALQQTHTATLVDLSTVSAKYRDALREISDLAAQIQEAKLSDVSVIDSGFIESQAVEKPIDNLPSRRRMALGRSREASDDSQTRLHFFRQAASAESLRSRSLSQSQSLSQELSSAHLRKTSSSSHGSSHSPSSSHSGVPPHVSSYLTGTRPSLSISLSSPQLSSNDRSMQSLEKEIMRLQEVLKEREAEITILETSLRESQGERPTVVSPMPTVPEDTSASVNGKVNISDVTLTPQTMYRFDHLRKTMENGRTNTETASEVNGSEADESLERLNELMLSMAQKESNHREVVEGLNAQLSQVQRQLDDLTTLSRDQAINMSTEMDCFRRKHDEDLALLDEVRSREMDLQEALRTAQTTHSTEVEELRVQHQQALEGKGREVDELISHMKEEHETALSRVRDELAQASAALEKSHRDHKDHFGALKAEHEEELLRRVQEANDVLDKTREEHAKAVAKAQSEHAETLKQKDAEANAVLQRTEEEYYNALTKIRGDHAEVLKQHTSELNATLERLREEHASEMRMAEIAREGSFSESQSSQSAALQELQEAHAAAIVRKESCFAEEMEILKSEQARTVKMKDDDHVLQMDRLRLEYESTMARLKEESRMEVDRLLSELKDANEETISKSSKAQKDLEAAVQAVKEQQALVLQEYTRGQEDQISQLTAHHESALQEAITRSAQQITAALQVHTEETSKLKAQHTQELAELNAALKKDQHRNMEAIHDQQDLLAKEKESFAVTLTALQEEHQQNLASVQARHDQALDEKNRLAADLIALQEDHHRNSTAAEEQNKFLVEEKTQLLTKLDTMVKQHSLDLQNLRGEHDIVRLELDSHKTAAEELALIREKTKQQHELVLCQKDDAFEDMERRLTNVHEERDELEAEVAQLRGELDKTRGEQSKLIQEASKRQSLVDEVERYRSILADLQETLQKVKDEKDAIQVEKIRADSLVRDLQAQVARGSPPPNARPVADRNMTYSRGAGLPPIKLPPPTPPPSVPPPPAPTATARGPSAATANGDAAVSVSSQNSSSTGSSRESQPESPSTSVGHSSVAPLITSSVDPKIGMKLEQQAKQLDEQEAMIKTLNKQLTHCETDLQTHMDLVTTLEASLGDSEKNLRKARMHATELARERDTLNTKIQTLQNDLTEAKREVVTVRRSIVEEKHSLEQRLDEERKAKERVRQQLDSRMEELQKRKSKFACL